MSSYPLPALINPLLLLAVFGGFSVGFHWLFVRWWPLGKIAWKRVDYVWLPMTLIGLLATAGSTRQAIAKNWLRLADKRLAFATEQLRRSVEGDVAVMGCISFVRSSYSPPIAEFNRVVAEYESACAWGKTAKLPTQPADPDEREHLTLSALGVPVLFPAPIRKSLSFTLTQYNESLSDRWEVSRASDKTEAELTLGVLGPFLIAAALALRLTKVTGEIRLETATTLPRLKPPELPELPPHLRPAMGATDAATADVPVT